MVGPSNYEIRHTYQTDSVQEFSVDYDGNSYLVIYGHHINGWFIAVPNWRISSEAGKPEDIFYNTEKLSDAFGLAPSSCVPYVIARAVNEHWETTGHNGCLQSADKKNT